MSRLELGVDFKNLFAQNLLPICMLGFMGSAFSFLRSVFSVNSRWAILFFLFLFVFKNRNIWRFLKPKLAFAFLLYMGWCFLSSFWSLVPILSLMKSIMLCAIALILIFVVASWVTNNSWRNCLNYLWLLAFVTIFTGFIGKHNASSSINFNNVYSGMMMTEGLVRGSNMFGTLLSMCFPYFLWNAYQYRFEKKYQWFWLFLTVSCLYLLALSMSRAAMLGAIITLVTFLLSLSLTKKLLYFGIAIIISFSVFIINPSYISNASNNVVRFIYKYDQSNLLSSRTEYWNRSLEAAQEGGWFGLGYGAAVGQTEFNFDHGLTAYCYGREKSNSQLAIIEETGIVGFVFYLILLTTIFANVITLYLKVREPELRVLIGIIGGSLVGILFGSIFEAWWGAPGGPESIYFWSLIGLIRGLEIIINKQEVYAASAFKTKNQLGLAGAI